MSGFPGKIVEFPHMTFLFLWQKVFFSMKLTVKKFRKFFSMNSLKLRQENNKESWGANSLLFLNLCPNCVNFLTYLCEQNKTKTKHDVIF